MPGKCSLKAGKDPSVSKLQGGLRSSWCVWDLVLPLGRGGACENCGLQLGWAHTGLTRQVWGWPQPPAVKMTHPSWMASLWIFLRTDRSALPALWGHLRGPCDSLGKNRPMQVLGGLRFSPRPLSPGLWRSRRADSLQCMIRICSGGLPGGVSHKSARPGHVLFLSRHLLQNITRSPVR